MIPPIFVTGCPRTGTTFMREILGGHPDIDEVVGESAIFLNGRLMRLIGAVNKEKALSEFLDYFWGTCYYRPNDWSDWVGGIHVNKPKEEYVQAVNDFREDYYSSPNKAKDISAIRNFVDEVCQIESPTWVEKTPLHCWAMTDIKKIFPNAVIIYMKRDRELIEASLPEQDWFNHPNPKEYLDGILDQVKPQLEQCPDVIEVDLLEFTRNPHPLFKTLIERGIPSDGFKDVLTTFNKKVDLDIATRKADSDRRIN